MQGQSACRQPPTVRTDRAACSCPAVCTRAIASPAAQLLTQRGVECLCGIQPAQPLRHAVQRQLSGRLLLLAAVARQLALRRVKPLAHQAGGRGGGGGGRGAVMMPAGRVGVGEGSAEACERSQGEPVQATQRARELAGELHVNSQSRSPSAHLTNASVALVRWSPAAGPALPPAANTPASCARRRGAGDDANQPTGSLSCTHSAVCRPCLLPSCTEEPASDQSNQQHQHPPVWGLRPPAAQTAIGRCRWRRPAWSVWGGAC